VTLLSVAASFVQTLMMPSWQPVTTSDASQVKLDKKIVASWPTSELGPML
jgi:hypothetical protein